jgi:hypothetical protein
MADPAYREFEILVNNLQSGETGERRFEVAVLHSPAGGCDPVERKIPLDLAILLTKLERRQLDITALITLGEALADLLLPDSLRDLFTRSLDRLRPDQGLRLRLHLPPGLADIPWEYMYIPRAGNPKDSDEDVTGFLSLDPRLSIVRHERLGVFGEFDQTPRPRRILAAFASPEGGFASLNLEREKSELSAILQGVTGLALDFWERARLADLQSQLAAGADIFHFAGHGDFDAEMGAMPFTIQGQGALIFEGVSREAVPVPADQFAANLSGYGVQLVVLGACLSGRRDGYNRWSGVVAALMEVGIPAAVAMQYKISDRAAIRFMTGFYSALATGMTLDRAVLTGRLAVFNDLHTLRDDPELGRLWQDWGLATLYLRTDQEFRLTSITDVTEQQKAEHKLSISINHRIGVIGAQGVYKAVEAGVVKAGSIETFLKINQMDGQVTQVEAERIEGGQIRVEGQVENFNGFGIGVRADVIGNSIHTPAQSKSDQPDTPSTRRMDTSTIECPQCESTNPVEANFCSNCGAAIKKTPKFCANCGNKLESGVNFCPNCGTKAN